MIEALTPASWATLEARHDSRPDNDERVFGPEQRGQSFARYLLASSLEGLRVLVGSFACLV